MFFGAQVLAPWPEQFPKGRIIPEVGRHCTLAFLGEIDMPTGLPLPSFRVGAVGKLDALLFLPENEPHVVAWHLHEFGGKLASYEESLSHWVEARHYPIDRRPFQPHVTIARTPFDKGEWKAAFHELPCMINAIHLYESLPNLNYIPRATHSLIPAFQEIEHTADIAFHIAGETLSELYTHAQVALAFHCPHLLTYFERKPIHSLDDMIIALNALTTRADSEIGCPFKAISFHGDVVEKDGILKWEMIVDV